MSKLASSDRFLIVASIAWLAVVLYAPTLHSLKPAFFATLGFIAVNGLVSLRRLTRQREVLIGLNCVQIGLFGLLNYQLYCAFGAAHYRFDREPRFYDWIEFALAHVLRVADVLDALDEYGLPIQTINHNSLVSSILLIGMHLAVDGFLIGLVLRWARRFWHEAPCETRLARGRRECGWLLATLAFFVAFAASQQMQPSDWILWPLDNVLRLVDVGDVLQIFGWKLHSVEGTYWTKAAAVLFRIAAGVWVARLVIWLRLIPFRTWGLSIEELTQLLDHPDAEVRRGAAVGLGRTGAVAASAAPALIEALHDISSAVRCDAAWALGQIGPTAWAAVPRLADAVWLSDRKLRLAAAEALGRIGPAAGSAVYSLVTLLKVSDTETSQAVMRALEQIAPDVLLQCQEDSVRSLLVQLTAEGYFDEERDTDSLRAALADKGSAIEFAELFLPLLALTAEGTLDRRKNELGRWVYKWTHSVPI